MRFVTVALAVVKGVALGLLVTALGTVPWSVLVGLNLKTSPAVPWAVPLMAGYLWLYWRYLQGDGWPRATSKSRRRLLRAAPLPVELWRISLIGCGGGAIAAMGVLGLLRRLVTMPEIAEAAPAGIPLWTVAAAVAMGAIVAGIAEEAGFRGYLQVALEGPLGPTVAIGVAALAFDAVHASHGFWFALLRLPFYAVFAGVFGAVAYLTGSILPGVVVHAAVDVLLLGLLVGLGRPAPPPLVWVSGPDPWFWAAAVEAVAGLVVAVWACRSLAAARRR
jgi:membrane protease YdiL (CAAX protease family)